MAYVDQELKASLTPAIKAVLAKYKVKGRLSVRNHLTLVLNIAEGPIDFIGTYNKVNKEANPMQHNDAKGSLSINQYWYHEHFDGLAKSFLEELIPAMKGPKFFDHSDSQTDYFHLSHYLSINIGQWDKPYVLTKKAFPD
jgi:hypothetical protein